MRSWCSSACKQRTLRDRKYLALKALLDKPGSSRTKLVAEVYDLLGEPMARAAARQAEVAARLAEDWSGTTPAQV